MRDMKLMRAGIEQPVADLAVLLRPMELRHQDGGTEQQKQQDARPSLHGSLRAVIFTGSWSSRSLTKLTRMRPSESVETMPGEAHPTNSHPAGSTTTLRLMPSGRSKTNWPSFNV